MGHLPVGRAFDDCRFFLERLDSQQTVMVRRLFLGRNSQPRMVRIERLIHVGILQFAPQQFVPRFVPERFVSQFAPNDPSGGSFPSDLSRRDT